MLNAEWSELVKDINQYNIKSIRAKCSSFDYLCHTNDLDQLTNQLRIKIKQSKFGF